MSFRNTGNTSFFHLTIELHDVRYRSANARPASLKSDLRK